MHQTKKGFTIIELMLAMTIVSLLVIAIATMTIQITTIITKGKTMKELNVAARSINSDFTEKFNSIQTIWGWDGRTSVTAAAAGASYVSNVDGGALCTGDFSYVWNTARALQNGNGPAQYAGSVDNSIRLVRIKDVSKLYCTDKNSWTQIPLNSNETTEILSAGEIDLMIHEIRFSAPSVDPVSGQSLINIQYVLGTRNQDGASITMNQCQPTNEFRDYCAINKFDLTVRTIGRR